MLDTRLMIRMWHDFTPETLTAAVAVWRRLLDVAGSSLTDECGYNRHVYARDVSDEWLTALVISDGAGVVGKNGDAVWTPLRLSLISYSDHGGSDLDAANVRSLEGTPGLQTSTDGIHGDSEAWLQVGEFDNADDDVPTMLGWLKSLADTMEGLSDYPLISDDTHGEYIDGLANDAWNQWLGRDVESTVQSELAAAILATPTLWNSLRLQYADEIAAFLALCTEGATIDSDDVATIVIDGLGDDVIRNLYYSFDGNEWSAESATSVVNGRHDDAVAYVVTTFVSRLTEASAIIADLLTP